MSDLRIAKLGALLARVVTRAAEPRAAVLAVAAAPAVAPVPQHAVATTPPPPPIVVPEVSIPRQPVFAAVTEVPAAGAFSADELQERTHVSRSSGPELVPHAAESHSRIATAPRAEDHASFAERAEEAAPVSSERTVDPSVEADTDLTAAPPESTRQLATNPPSAQARSASVRPSTAPSPVVTRGSLPPDANDAVEFRGELPLQHAPTVGELLDATFLL